MATLTVNDTAPTLTGTCTSGGAAASLVGATVAVHIKRPDRTVLTKTATLVDPDHGQWSVDWVTGDLSIKGQYKVEAQVTFSNMKVQTFGPQTLYVQGELA